MKTPVKSIKCPNCSATYRLTDEIAANDGREARCALCKTVFKIDTGKPPVDTETTGEPVTELIEETQELVEENAAHNDTLNNLDEIVDELESLTTGDTVDETALNEESEDATLRLKPAADKPTSRAGTGWWLAGLALLVALAAQLAWQFRAHPDVYPVLASLCETVGCNLTVRRAPDQFLVTNRLFTRVANSSDHFQLQLQLVNTASWAQPYPNIELTLTDKNGTTRVRQLLSPENYLDTPNPGLIEPGASTNISFIAESSSDAITGFSLEFL